MASTAPPQGLCTCPPLSQECILHPRCWGPLASVAAYVLLRGAGIEHVKREDGFESGQVRGRKMCERVGLVQVGGVLGVGAREGLGRLRRAPTKRDLGNPVSSFL